MVLDLRAIQKRFGGVTALRRGDLSVNAGEVHLLLGENGAGKSTLMKIVAGLYQADAGEMIWRGEPASFRNPAAAQRAGVAMVHQESLLCPHMTVAENIFLGHEPTTKACWLEQRALAENALRLIQEHGFPLKADERVERLGPAGRQLVEICRALAHKASLVIFDEPTSSLSDSETKEVFRLVRKLRDSGAAVIYITHRMEELRAIGDRVTVLRDGETVYSGEMAKTSTPDLIRYMVGRSFEAIYRREPVAPGKELLRVKNLSRRGVLHNISFSLRAGEIVGLAGLVGAGRTELCRALFGIDPVDSGEVFVEERAVKIESPRDAVRCGVGLIPEDRQKDGLALGLALRENISLASLPRFAANGFLKLRLERDAGIEQMRALRIKADSQEQRAAKLSGGNQQKVVISKWSLRGSRVILFDEPTRGIDIGAKSEVFQVMDSLARGGATILMVSSELPELLQVADRILVMREGRITAELPKATTQEEILEFAMLDRAQP